MSIASLIGTTVVGGVVIGVIGYFGYFAFKPLWNKIKLQKEIPRVRTFLKQLDSRFPPGKLTNEQREEREKAMIESGFSPQAITIAQSTQPSEVEQIVEWFQEAIEIHGKSMFEAEKLLIDNGWNQKSINKAKKRLFKLNKKGVPNVKQPRKIPSFQGEQSPGIDSGAGKGNGNRDGDGKIEHKRVLPVSTSESFERDKSKSQWNWGSFKQTR